MFIGLGIDYLIYPEKIAAKEIVGLLSQTSTSDVVDFSGGKLHLYAFKLEENAPIINKSLMEVSSPGEFLEYRAVAITRNSQTIIPHGAGPVPAWRPGLCHFKQGRREKPASLYREREL